MTLDIQKVYIAACSGEYIGFCTECGAEHYNIEPDAREYKCESCGAFAVMGAEEILFTEVFDVQH